MAKNLIIYYSRKGENYFNGSIRDIPKGNTEIVAEFIQKAVGGDLFEVDTVKTYATDYYECIDDAKAELRADAKPELKEYLDDYASEKTKAVGDALIEKEKENIKNPEIRNTSALRFLAKNLNHYIFIAIQLNNI